MFGFHNHCRIINCQPQEQSGDNNVVLQLTRTYSFQIAESAISNVRITPDQVLKLAIYLQESTWDDQLANCLAEYLLQLTELQDVNINLSNSNIGNDHLQLIISALSTLKKVDRFVIHIHVCPNLQQGYLETIFKYLQATKTHTFVQIHNGANQSSGSDFKIVADYLIGNNILEELNFQSFENSYDEEAHSYLCKGLVKNNHLKKLVLQTITEPPKFWDHLVECLKFNSQLESIFVRFLGGGNEKKLAIGLYKIYQTSSHVTIAVNTGHSSVSNFRELQKAKRETQWHLAAFYNHIKSQLITNPSIVTADLYYD